MNRSLSVRLVSPMYCTISENDLRFDRFDIFFFTFIILNRAFVSGAKHMASFY